MSYNVTKVALIHDELTETWSSIFKAPGVAGKTVRAEVANDHLQPVEVLKALLKNGAALPPLSKARPDLEKAIEAEAKIQHRAAQPGWRHCADDQWLFVGHHYVVGDAEDVLPPDIKKTAAVRLKNRGTLAGWQKTIEAAEHSTAIMLALCAPFAAPLLAPLNRSGFSLVLVGPSGLGKSFAQFVAASVIGFDCEEAIPIMKSTDPGRLSYALTFNDHFLPINEVGTADGGKQAVYGAIRSASYDLSCGQDKGRHSSYSGSGDPSTFRVIPLFSSEYSPEIWAERSGETRDDGELRRMIGVPLQTFCAASVFDRPPRELKGEALTEWTIEKFSLMRAGLKQQCGFAFKEYLETFINDFEGNVSRVRKAVGQFEGHLSKPDMTVVERDIVTKFGILCAAGALAIRLGILPFKKRNLGVALVQACQAALSELPDKAAHLKADILILKQHLESAAIMDGAKSKALNQSIIRSANGFYRAELQGREYIIRATEFRKFFSSELRMRILLDHLEDEGFLRHARSKKVGRSIEWAETQTTWPNGTRVRSICIYLPKGTSDLMPAS